MFLRQIETTLSAKQFITLSKNLIFSLSVVRHAGFSKEIFFYTIKELVNHFR